MIINYWNCDFQDYDESWDGEEETRVYGCTHPNGCGNCPLYNKFSDATDDCKLLDVKD